MKAKKGIVTTAILIFISGLLMVILLFDDSTLRFFLAQQMQRKHYVERTLTLQKMTSAEKQNACKNLPLDNSEKVRQISITLDGANDAIQYSLWCQRVAIFKKTPTKGVNQGLFDHFIRMENLSEFRPHFLRPANPLLSNQIPQIYWFDQNQATWEISGKVQGILIAEGDLTLRGNGRISGAIITGGTLTLEGVTVAYGKKVIEPLVWQYSKWQLAEKSWSDFKISSE
ncbi:MULTISPECIES: DUF2572 family protein [Rodentibacter]|uniref:DUF2572 family protein n=1 Tax=Rodentibacter TaxID=1960084 RepID=UPI001CFC638D|nr:DUF2572 family protein [Rodentibacter sp. JRC1]